MYDPKPVIARFRAQGTPLRIAFGQKPRVMMMPVKYPSVLFERQVGSCGGLGVTNVLNKDPTRAALILRYRIIRRTLSGKFSFTWAPWPARPWSPGCCGSSTRGRVKSLPLLASMPRQATTELWPVGYLQQGGSFVTGPLRPEGGSFSTAAEMPGADRLASTESPHALSPSGACPLQSSLIVDDEEVAVLSPPAAHRLIIEPTPVTM